jgi:hypothetical protein
LKKAFAEVLNILQFCMKQVQIEIEPDFDTLSEINCDKTRFQQILLYSLRIVLLRGLRSSKAKVSFKIDKDSYLLQTRVSYTTNYSLLEAYE